MSRTSTIFFLLWVPIGCSGAESSECQDRAGKAGTLELRLVDAARQRPLNVRIWYPAVADAAQGPIVYSGIYSGCSAPNAGYLEGKAARPLVLLSHGDGGGNTDQSWLAEYLVANGYVVAAVDHWKNTAMNHIPEETVRVWHRPADVSYVITALLNDPAWKGRIDPGRIGVAGHSSGGYTALALLGARYNWHSLSAYCTGPSRGPDCDLAKNADLKTIDFSGSNDDFADTRIRAAFVMAPALGQAIEKESLARIGRPVHIVYAKDDEILNPELNAISVATGIRTAETTVLESGRHFVFLPECTPQGKRIVSALAFDICGVNAKADRAAVHRQVASVALQFLNKSLESPVR